MKFTEEQVVKMASPISKSEECHSYGSRCDEETLLH